MTRLVLIIGLIMGCLSGVMAQWTSAGNGTTYTLRNLVEQSDGCVIYVDTLASYCVMSDLTIAANDCLTVVPSDCQTNPADALGIYCQGDIQINIHGWVRINNDDMLVYIRPLDGSNLRIRFEECSAPSIIVRTNF